MIKSKLLATYERWKLILEKSASLEPKDRLGDFQDFLSHFPFSSKTWNQYAHLQLAVNGKEKCLETFRKALTLNPKLLPLHLSFCLWVEEAYREEPEFVEKTYQRSLKQLSQNFEADKLYNFYIKFLNKKMKYKQCNDVFWDLLRGNMFNVREFVGR
jgi:tetratricopeptide (TPR) repeat protein